MPDERSGSAVSLVCFDAAWCATDLGEYRDCRYTWIENRLWHAVDGGNPSQLEPQLRSYLRHCAPSEASA
ncbi:hypothetical protein ACFW9N_01150 [Streptomyces sp. NPDC059496]|uniref:hypothetical protein n=1 Tax=Streptomyces sp. NPDC059496 TaxID=3346851 RepID=UPI0036CAC5B0